MNYQEDGHRAPKIAQHLRGKPSHLHAKAVARSGFGHQCGLRRRLFRSRIGETTAKGHRSRFRHRSDLTSFGSPYLPVVGGFVYVAVILDA
jgi:hypothetical protein